MCIVVVVAVDDFVVAVADVFDDSLEERSQRKERINQQNHTQLFGSQGLWKGN